MLKFLIFHTSFDNKARQPWRHCVTSLRSLNGWPVAWNWRRAVLSSEAGLVVALHKIVDHITWNRVLFLWRKVEKLVWYYIQLILYSTCSFLFYRPFSNFFRLGFSRLLLRSSGQQFKAVNGVPTTNINGNKAIFLVTFERLFVKRFTLCYRAVVLSCLSVLSVTLVHCGQTVGLINMKLGTLVGLGPGHTVLDGDPAPPAEKGTAAPHSKFTGGGFACIRIIRGPCLLWPNGWMDQDATWQGGRPWCRPHCVRWGGSSPSPKGAQPSSLPNFWPICVVAKRLDGSRCHLVGW